MSYRTESTYPKGPTRPTEDELRRTDVLARQDALHVPQPTHGGGTGADSRRDTQEPFNPPITRATETSASQGHRGEQLDKTLRGVGTGHERSDNGFGPNNTNTMPNSGRPRTMPQPGRGETDRE
jgi:hypothetical protein